MKVQSSVGPFKKDGVIVSDNKGMAEMLNSFFKSVFTADLPSVQPRVTALPCDYELLNMTFDPATVKKKILKLKHGSAPGPDGITVSLLKSCVTPLSSALSIIFNKSMEEGLVPVDWRTANVTPIHKKGSRANPENYRPVSLTSICCKIMESCIRDAIVSHLEVNGLIHKSQHGFMRNKSCTTNLLEFLEFLTSSIDAGQPVDVVYLDFAKAFDKVPHSRLLQKFRAHGVDGNILSWIGAWLADRRQRTVLNGEASEWGLVGSGVPQGSVLGPLAFVVFINDLDECTVNISKVNKFADDTKVGNVIKDQLDVANLQQCLDKLVDWADTWGMKFNTGKCKVMHLGHNNTKAEYKMNGQVLQATDAEKDIGVRVQSSLRPGKQCAEAAGRANAVLNQILRAFHYRNRHTYIDLYKQYVRPHLEFAVPAWSPWTQGDKEAVERVQRRAIKAVSGLAANTYEGRLKELGLLTLEARRDLFDLVQTFKIVHGLDDVNKDVWFTMIGDNPARVTRETSDPLNFVRQNPRTEVRRNFFSNRVINKWNNLPSELKSAVSVNSFKRQLKELFLSSL